MQEQLTKSDVAKIEAEIEHRKMVVRKEAIEAVKEARAHGDLSENFEYYAAKRDKNKNESRIRYLERMLRTARIVSDESGEDEVGLNNLVELYFEEDDETEVNEDSDGQDMPTGEGMETYMDAAAYDDYPEDDDPDREQEQEGMEE